MPQTAMAPAAAMPNPYLTGQVEAAPAPIAQAQETGPIEFDPSAYMANQQETLQAPPPPAPTQEPLRDFTQPELMPNAAISAELPHPPALDQALPYSDPAYADPSYANPAYAEVDPTMDRVRIGGRNLRVAALATGVAVVGLVAAKGIFGGGDGTLSQPPLPQQTAQNALPPVENTAPVSVSAPDTSAATIGDYEDNKAVAVEPSSDAAKTLNSEAAAGNPVAQFQLGLSYLEQGRTDEGVSLIRKSANQNQPAAQYRLAKLYEIGEGVLGKA